MKHAVIIGASSGLGFEVARILLNDGWHIGVAARRSELLLGLRQMCPDRVTAETIDVTADDAPQRLRRLIERVGGMQLFFYASGIGRQNIGLEADTELATVSTNSLGFTRMVGEAYRYMAGCGGGHIAVISSIAGTKGLGVAPSYSATKAFQNTYIQALDQQARMRGLNIRFTDIRPGFVTTELLGDACRYPMLMQSEAVARIMVRAVYLKRRVIVIDWRWRILTALWRCIPDSIWRRMKVSTH